MTYNVSDMRRRILNKNEERGWRVGGRVEKGMGEIRNTINLSKIYIETY